MRNFKSIGFFVAFIFLLFGATSCEDESTSPDVTPPAEVENFIAEAKDSKITLSWTEPKDEDFSGVEVSCEQKAGSLANSQTLKKGTTSLIVYGLENGTEYTFEIKTFDKNGNHSEGIVCKGTPVDLSDKTPPAEVKNFTSSVMDSKIILSWTEPDDEDFSGVEISCESKAGSMENAQTLKKGATSLIVYGLENGVEYTFTVKTFDESGNFSEGIVCKGTPVDSSDKTPPAVPSAFMAEAMDKAAKLSWMDSHDKDVFGYELTWTSKTTRTVARAIFLMESDSLFISPSKNGINEITIMELENGTEYTFTLKAMDDSGNKSEGTTAKCTPTSIPEVSTLTAIYYDGKTHFSWTNPSENFSSVEIFENGRKVTAEAKQVSSIIYGNYSYCVLENTMPGKNYIVKAKNKSGQLSVGMATTSVDTGLPVVVVDTENCVDVADKENKINATMNILNSGNLKNPDPDAKLTIKGRGNSSWGMAKKSYTLKLDSKSKILGMEKHKTWAMIANYADKTLLRNSIAYEMGRNIFTNMDWNPNTRNVHFYLNGCYLGVYMLTESVKIDEKRVNIKNIKDCVNIEDVGDYGFLLEVNARLDEDFNFRTTRGVCFSLKDPEGKDISEDFKQVIQDTIQRAEDALYSDDFTISGSENFYENYFDVDSFIDWWLVNEIAKNRDAVFFTSCYMFFDPTDKKLKMGPLWDFDIGFGNDGETNCGNPEDFYNKNAGYLERMFKDESFTARAKARWNEKYLELKNFFYSDIKSQFKELSSEANANFVRWQTLGIYIWPNAAGYENRTTYKSECDYLSDWVYGRLVWLNMEINNW